MIRDYKLRIPANTREGIEVKGHFFGFMSSSVPNDSITLRAIDSDGGSIASVEMMIGDKLPDLSGYDRLEIHNNSSNLAEITVVAGTGQFDSDRLSGQVSIAGVVKVDQVARSEVSREFYGSDFDVSMSAGKYGFVELYNPIDSGVVVLVTRINILSVSGGVGIIKYLSQEMVTPTPVGVVPIGSKRAGEKTQSKVLKGAGLDLSTNYHATNNYPSEFVYCGYIPRIGDRFSLNISETIGLGEGERLVVYTGGVANHLGGFFEWEEVEIESN